MQQLCHTCPLQLSLLFASWAGKCEGTQNIEIYTLNHFCEVFHFMLATAHWFQTFEGFIFQLLARIQTVQGSNFLLLARFQKVKGLIFVFSNVTSFLLVVKNWIQTLKGLILGGDFLIQTFKGLKPSFFSVFLVNWARFWDENSLFSACLFSAGVAVNQMASFKISGKTPKFYPVFIASY